MGCCDKKPGGLYITTAEGIAKLVAIHEFFIVAKAVGAAPVILAVLLFDYYSKHERPQSDLGIRIQAEQRDTWELAFLIVVASALVATVFNLLLCTCFKSATTSLWSKRIDCGFMALGGTAQTVVGFIMVACALTSSQDHEPVDMKYAAGFLGIASGIIYWGAATLVNQD